MEEIAIYIGDINHKGIWHFFNLLFVFKFLKIYLASSPIKLALFKRGNCAYGRS